MKVTGKYPVDFGEKYENLTVTEQKKICEVLGQVIDDSASEVDTVIFALNRCYLFVSHIIDSNLYSAESLKKHCENLKDSFLKTKIRPKMPMIFVLVTPLKYTKPISESQTLSDLFVVSSTRDVDSSSYIKGLDSSDFLKLERIDTILKKYNGLCANNLMIVKFNDEFNDSSKEFYMDLVRLLQKNIDISATISLDS